MENYREYLDIFNKIEDSEFRFMCRSSKKLSAEHNKKINDLKEKLFKILTK